MNNRPLTDLEKMVGREIVKDFDLFDYRISKILGDGAYGAVYECEHKGEKGPEHYAVKVLKGIYNNLVDARRVARELALLLMLNHPYIIRFINATLHENEALSIALEPMEKNLQEKMETESFDSKTVENTLYQLLSVLKYAHAENIIHRDLKPKNILINKDGTAKLIDFNLARIVGEPAVIKTDVAEVPNLNVSKKKEEKAEEEPLVPPKTAYVVTRWYRAPEVLLALEYTTAVDIWSLGINFLLMLLNMAKLYHEKAVIEGESKRDQKKIVFTLVGTKDDLDSVVDAIDHIMLAQVTGVKRLETLIEMMTTRFKAKGISATWMKNAFDLLRKMLVINPQNRISASNGLNHDFIKDVAKAHNEDSIPSLSAQLKAAKEAMANPQVHKWSQDKAPSTQPFSAADRRLFTAWGAAVRTCQLEKIENKGLTRTLLEKYFKEMTNAFPAALLAIPSVSALPASILTPAAPLANTTALTLSTLASEERKAPAPVRAPLKARTPLKIQPPLRSPLKVLPPLSQRIATPASANSEAKALSLPPLTSFRPVAAAESNTPPRAAYFDAILPGYMPSPSARASAAMTKKLSAKINLELERNMMSPRPSMNPPPASVSMSLPLPTGKPLARVPGRWR